MSYFQVRVDSRRLADEEEMLKQDDRLTSEKMGSVVQSDVPSPEDTTHLQRKTEEEQPGVRDLLYHLINVMSNEISPLV